MQFVYKYLDSIPVITFSREDGSLLEDSIESFCEEVIKLLKDNEHRVAFDLRHNTYLNSFGLGELINIRQFLFSRGISCILIVESKKIYKLFEMVGIEELFKTVSSEDKI